MTSECILKGSSEHSISPTCLTCAVWYNSAIFHAIFVFTTYVIRVNKQQSASCELLDGFLWEISLKLHNVC